MPPGKMITFTQVRADATIGPPTTPSQTNAKNLREQPCFWSEWWVTLCEQTRDHFSRVPELRKDTIDPAASEREYSNRTPVTVVPNGISVYFEC
jgi:hypothetical protein